MVGRKQATLPPLSWTKDKGALIWKLLAQVEKPENRVVILGRKDSSENSSGTTKAAIFKAIGQTILPNEYAIDHDAVGKRVKLKYEDIYATYKKHTKRLNDTGGGLGGNDNNDESLHEYMACYIPSDGPDASTTEDAKNLWDQITKEFPFFPTFHRLYSTRANVNPPIVITGVGPVGRKIVHLQPPSESERFPDALIDPQLFDLAAMPPPKEDSPSLTPVFSDWEVTPVKSPVRKPSTLLRAPLVDIRNVNNRHVKVKWELGSANLSAAFLKARENVTKIPAKRSLEDTLADLHESTVQQAVHRAILQDNMAQRRLMLDEKAQLIEMQKLGIYSKEEFLAELATIEQRYKPATQPKPAKRPRLDVSTSDVEIVSP